LAAGSGRDRPGAQHPAGDAARALARHHPALPDQCPVPLAVHHRLGVVRRPAEGPSSRARQDRRTGEELAVTTGITIENIDGEAIHVVESGPADGPPLLLSGGLGEAWFDWTPTVELLEQRHHVINFDR